MIMHCRCGEHIDMPPSTLARMGRQPAGTVSMWCLECATCGTPSAWGWTLADGREVGCLAGDDQAEDAGAVVLANERTKKALRKIARRT